MFLKSLKISSSNGIIRYMQFKKGINLIVDETPSNDNKSTGNNVGKTTVLKLIDFCLGGSPKIIYSGTESRDEEYTLVKNFLVDNEILITLVLCNDLVDCSSQVTIERNFLSRSKAIRRINGEDIQDKQFEDQLNELCFPEHLSLKPTFRQIISHNIRYSEQSITQTLRTLDKYTTDTEYESLHLYLFGCEFDDGDLKQEITTKLKQEESYKERLEKKQTKTAYEAALSLLNDEIVELNRKKSSLNINESFENEFEKLNEIKYQINSVSSGLSNLRIRKGLILETSNELNKSQSNIDLQQLNLIYLQAKKELGTIQKTFEDLVSYHNRMINEKIKFITRELPELETKIMLKTENLKLLLDQEKIVASALAASDSYIDLENIITELNEKYRNKGEYDSIIAQLTEVEGNIANLKKQLGKIEESIFSNAFENQVKLQTEKFSKIFSAVSSMLYGEKYAITYDKVQNKNGVRIYKFKSFNTNMSSGKKQGEILCFDLAYTLFADQENISCLHFLLNDKKELMHGHQLLELSRFISDKNIQFVASILEDKLPEELKREEYYVVTLSQSDKLFRIEGHR